MARQLRLQYDGAFYHVTARGNERRKIYFSEYDYQKFREYLGTAQGKYGYKLHCYVLMTNHALCGAPHKARNGNFNVFEKDFLRRKAAFLITSEIECYIVRKIRK